MVHLSPADKTAKPNINLIMTRRRRKKKKKTEVLGLGGLCKLSLKHLWNAIYAKPLNMLNSKTAVKSNFFIPKSYFNMETSIFFTLNACFFLFEFPRLISFFLSLFPLKCVLLLQVGKLQYFCTLIHVSFCFDFPLLIFPFFFNCFHDNTVIVLPVKHQQNSGYI
ncbi:hypothetical protein KUTeg_011250 [Tegillarca granosa]|uniref:Transmembrane protein n=1 Tax=Tegillarca granosa TaxID=220873 RepID=A0ABQ9F4R1_TEGGR|nr:hypothetical protein KUTeg_011250 [Tegillarca granosa]